MTTTIMKDSVVGDQWIRDTAAAVPVQRVVKKNETTGQMEYTGDILTGPVRLSFVNLFELPKPTASMANPKYSALLMFTPFFDPTIFNEEYYNVCAAVFGAFWNGTNYVGLHSPFHDQGEKFKLQGFTAGCTYMTCSSKYKPPVVDARGNPIVDPSKVHAGVWAICALKAYSYGLNPPQPKKGPGFGLQSVMVIGDDTNLAQGAGADPTTQFKGIQIAAPIVRPNLAAMPSAMVPPGAPQIYPPAAPVMPGMTSQSPGMPITIQTTYRPAMPPPPPPGSDDELLADLLR